MSKRRWNGREQLGFIRALEEELNDPEMLRTVAEETDRSQPLNRIRELHGASSMDPEQADLEADE